MNCTLGAAISQSALAWRCWRSVGVSQEREVRTDRRKHGRCGGADHAARTASR